MLTDEELDKYEQGLSWVALSGDRARLAAVFAQAREANALRAQLTEVQLQRAEATGPHCPSCGNAIDPDCCWCGSTWKNHSRDDGHGFIPMGCDCCRDDDDRDWKRASSNLREQSWSLTKQLAEARQLLAAQAPVISAARLHTDNEFEPGSKEDHRSFYALGDACEKYDTWLATHPVTVGGEVKP